MVNIIFNCFYYNSNRGLNEFVPYSTQFGVNPLKTYFIPLNAVDIHFGLWNDELNFDTYYLSGNDVNQGSISSSHSYMSLMTIGRHVYPVVYNKEDGRFEYRSSGLIIEDDEVRFAILIKSEYIIKLFSDLYDYIFNHSKFYSIYKQQPDIFPSNIIAMLKYEYVRAHVKDEDILRNCYVVNRYNSTTYFSGYHFNKLKESNDIILENTFIKKKLPVFREIDEPEQIVNHVLEQI